MTSKPLRSGSGARRAGPAGIDLGPRRWAARPAAGAALALLMLLPLAATAQTPAPTTPAAAPAPTSPTTPATAGSGIVVIAHKSVPVDRIDAGQATQIFLKQLQTWPDGAPIQPIDLKEGSPLRAEFYARVTGRSPGQLRAFWARQAFTGMGFPPREVATPEEVSKLVQATPGSVGYIDKRSADAATKVLLDTTR